MKQKYYLALTKEDRYTDTVDEVLVKAANAKIKKIKVIMNF